MDQGENILTERKGEKTNCKVLFLVDNERKSVTCVYG